MYRIVLTAHMVPCRLQPIHMDVSDTTKPVMDMLVYEPESPTEFFVLDKFTGEQYDTVFLRPSTLNFPSKR